MSGGGIQHIQIRFIGLVQFGWSLSYIYIYIYNTYIHIYVYMFVDFMVIVYCIVRNTIYGVWHVVCTLILIYVTMLYSSIGV